MNKKRECVCVCVCVWERERGKTEKSERERGGERQRDIKHIHPPYKTLTTRNYCFTFSSLLASTKISQFKTSLIDLSSVELDELS
jgi:hypothetical protein